MNQNMIRSKDIKILNNCICRTVFDRSESFLIELSKNACQAVYSSIF